MIFYNTVYTAFDEPDTQSQHRKKHCLIKSQFDLKKIKLRDIANKLLKVMKKNR